MTLDERPQATTLHELLLEVRGGYVLHRPILVDVTPADPNGPDTTIDRTLTMQLPASGEPTLAAELAGCRFVLIGPNTLHAAAEPPITIGRSRRCGVRVDNESVSKVHGAFGFDEARGYVVVDEHSRNGTRVNGQPLAPGTATSVYAGAQVSFGDATFVFIDPPTLRKLARLAT
ncbi:MAG: FHA domain-containing protein [Myxococcales bacterium]|nr:FHA domain-containing protein [Myxococcales bacterium]